MTRGETGKLLNTLLRWYPQARQLQGDLARIQDAWLAALEAYDYDDVLAKAQEWYRGPKGRFCPDPRELIPEKPSAAKEPEQKRGPVTPEDKLRIMDYLYGYRKGASGPPDPEGYLAALDDWERTLDSNGLTDRAVRAAIDRKRQEIAGKEDVA